MNFQVLWDRVSNKAKSLSTEKLSDRLLICTVFVVLLGVVWSTASFVSGATRDNDGAVYAATETETTDNPVARTREYPMRELEGRRFVDLYTRYTGIVGVAPEVAELNFAEQLDRLCDYKARRRGVYPVAVESCRELSSEYRQFSAGSMTLSDYVATADAVAEQTCRSIDWQRVGRLKGLNAERQRLVQRISCAMGGRELIAYGLTELMPSDDGKFNVQVADFLVRNAGRRYLESIPAQYDRYASMGLYQFTSFALYHVGNERRGASVINQALPNELRVPDSVARLRGDQHHRAAYLFAVSNMADLVRNLSPRELRTLQRVWRSHQLDLLEYVATAHHRPAAAQPAARRWLANGARLHYEVSCPSSIRLYAKKTHNNYQALRAW